MVIIVDEAEIRINPEINDKTKTVIKPAVADAIMVIITFPIPIIPKIMPYSKIIDPVVMRVVPVNTSTTPTISPNTI